MVASDAGHPARGCLQGAARASFTIVATSLQQCLTQGDGLNGVDLKKREKLFPPWPDGAPQETTKAWRMPLA